MHWKASALSSAPPEGADRPGLASKYFTSRVVQPFDAYTQSPCVWWKPFVGTRNQPPGKDAEQNWPLFSRIGPSTTPAPQKISSLHISEPILLFKHIFIGFYTLVIFDPSKIASWCACTRNKNGIDCFLIEAFYPYSDFICALIPKRNASLGLDSETFFFFFFFCLLRFRGLQDSCGLNGWSTVSYKWMGWKSLRKYPETVLKLKFPIFH